MLYFGGQRDLVKVQENNVNQFWFKGMANLLIFIHNGGIKLLYSPYLKMVAIFLVLPIFLTAKYILRQEHKYHYLSRLLPIIIII